jgi:hypothetical protein
MNSLVNTLAYCSKNIDRLGVGKVGSTTFLRNVVGLNVMAPVKNRSKRYKLKSEKQINK